jgi:hypothetical protein
MADCDRHSHHTAKALAEEVGLLDLEVLQRSGDVVAHLLKSHRAIDVGCPSVALELDGNQLPIFGERVKTFAQPQAG